MDGSHRPPEYRREQSAESASARRPDAQGDPYATPKPPKDRGGALVRTVVLATILGGAAVGGYFYMQNRGDPVPLGQAALDAEPANSYASAAAPQQFAEAPATEEAAPAQADAAPQPASRAAAPTPAPEVELTPAPVIEMAPPAAPVEPM